MANILQGTAKTVARSPSERRLGWGFSLFGVGAGAMTALGILQYPLLLGGLSLAAMLFGFWLIVHGNSPRALQPNLSIARALDYLVNDSTAVLDQNPAPEVSTFGPTKGRLVRWVGKPQEHALRKIEEQLGFGTLTAFGRSALTSGNEPVNFDTILRIIPRDYWDVGGLHPLFARIDESSHAQTHLRSSVGGHSLFAEIRFDADELKAVWKPKSVWRRLWERRIKGRERIGDYLNDPMPTLTDSS